MFFFAIFIKIEKSFNLIASNTFPAYIFKDFTNHLWQHSLKDQGCEIEQQTGFPSSNNTTLLFKTGIPKSFTVYIRRPWWATTDFIVNINGVKQNIASFPSSYVALNRVWKKGDRIDVQIPITLYEEAIPGNPNKIAVLYGPLVLAGKVLPKNDDRLFDVPVLVINKTDPSMWIEKKGDSLVFQIVNIAQPYDPELVSFYVIQDERQVVYWDLYKEAI